jgi:hypothetical protein
MWRADRRARSSFASHREHTTYTTLHTRTQMSTHSHAQDDEIMFDSLSRPPCCSPTHSLAHSLARRLLFCAVTDDPPESVPWALLGAAEQPPIFLRLSSVDILCESIVSSLSRQTSFFHCDDGTEKGGAFVAGHFPVCTPERCHMLCPVEPGACPPVLQAVALVWCARHG